LGSTVTHLSVNSRFNRSTVSKDIANTCLSPYLVLENVFTLYC
jgi:hypothetical protein